jgi:hypothetical protein
MDARHVVRSLSATLGVLKGLRLRARPPAPIGGPATRSLRVCGRAVAGTPAVTVGMRWALRGRTLAHRCERSCRRRSRRPRRIPHGWPGLVMVTGSRPSARALAWAAVLESCSPLRATGVVVNEILRGTRKSS